MPQRWDDSKKDMPEIGGLDLQDEGKEQAAGRKGLGSYAAKLQAAKQRGLGSDPDQVQQHCSSFFVACYKMYVLGLP